MKRIQYVLWLFLAVACTQKPEKAPQTLENKVRKNAIVEKYPKYLFQIPVHLRGNFSAKSFEEFELGSAVIQLIKNYQNIADWQAFDQAIRDWYEQYKDWETVEVEIQQLALTLLDDKLLTLESQTDESLQAIAYYTEKMVALKNPHSEILADALKKLEGHWSNAQLKAQANQLLAYTQADIAEFSDIYTEGTTHLADKESEELTQEEGVAKGILDAIPARLSLRQASVEDLEALIERL